MTSKDQVSFSVTFLAGAVAGISEILVMYPLDVVTENTLYIGSFKVKTRFQLSVGSSEYTGMMNCLVSIVKKEGVSRLYRGILPPVLMEAPKRATKFSANDQWGKFYRNVFNQEKMDQRLSLITGATAGATELQDKTSASKYKGTFDCVRKIIRNEGVFAFYNGLEATMLRHITWNSGYFGVIFSVQDTIKKLDWKTNEKFNNFIAGTLGGITGTLLNTPFDVAKSRIQNTPKIPNQIPKYNWAIPSLWTIFKEEGFFALYKGFLPKVIRLGPGGGILLVVFDQCIFQVCTDPNPSFNRTKGIDPYIQEKSDVSSSFTLPDCIQTETACNQLKTERICLDYLLSQPVEPELHLTSHLNYLLKVFTKPLPKLYVALDASQPWIIYWTLCSYALLGQSTDAYEERTISSIASMQLTSGGFGGGHGQIAHLASTYAAVMALCIIGSDAAYNCINREALYRWILQLKQPDGGFIMHEGGEEDARAVYCALSVASLLNIMTQELIEGTVTWLSKCQTYEGGLSGYPNSEAHGGYTFCILASLCLIGPPRKMIEQYLNVPKLLRWLAFRQSTIEGGFSGRTNKLVDGCYTWWIGGCLAILSVVVEDISELLVEKNSLRKFILKCCQYQNGGLRDKPDKYPDQYHTCYCIAGLSVIQNMFTYLNEHDSIPLGKSVFYWRHQKTIEQSVFAMDHIKAVHPILCIPMDKIDSIYTWHNKQKPFPILLDIHVFRDNVFLDEMLTCAYCLNICFYPKASLQLEAFLEQLFGVSLSEDLVYKIQQTAKQPKASIFERLPSEDIEYYQDIHKRAAEFSWGEKRDFFQKETEITHLNKGKQQLENNTQENRDLRVEYILVEWLDMEKEEKNIVEVKQQEQNHQEFLLKDKKTSLSKSQLTHKVPHAQYILLHEGTGNAQKHGIANFGFGIIQIYRYDEEKISTVDERWNNEK
ncbi:hypothetical protein PORY_000660 [Pneumocystis oryctolagi]|uniref:Uncharacterized protein n=1 Tax=Pneumocystis oryctolagi TaxID=42067 RepID=A0ACB7CE13_9ASCO|nr:hypothetical protein PORY_000660 [Pneumocystis oryctolagi]